jgi:predicted RNA methylase
MGKMVFGVAASGGVLTFGWMLLGPYSRYEVDEDPRDIRQLSSVPLSKLCSGWM